jgi:hypothetical protein
VLDHHHIISFSFFHSTQDPGTTRRWNHNSSNINTSSHLLAVQKGKKIEGTFHNSIVVFENLFQTKKNLKKNT